MIKIEWKYKMTKQSAMNDRTNFQQVGSNKWVKASTAVRSLFSTFHSENTAFLASENYFVNVSKFEITDRSLLYFCKRAGFNLNLVL